RYLADTIQQADLIRVGSLPVVVLTGFFTGLVLALQSSNTLQRFGSLSLIGQLVSTSMVRELGPVLTSLMVAGRNSSGMASELGSMVVTEQIDAMRALGTDPTKKPVPPALNGAVLLPVFFDYHFRPGRLGRRRLHRAISARLGRPPVLEQRLPDAGLRRRVHGLAEASNFWLHHRNCGLLLRPDCKGGDAGCRSRHDSGSGGRICAHSRVRRARDSTADGLNGVSLSLCRCHPQYHHLL